MTRPHHHAYVWLGHGDVLVKPGDAHRRSGHPEFRSAQVMPLECADWLLKPAVRIAGTARRRTWRGVLLVLTRRDPQVGGRLYGQLEHLYGQLAHHVSRLTQTPIRPPVPATCGWSLTDDEIYGLRETPGE